MPQKCKGIVPLVLKGVWQWKERLLGTHSSSPGTKTQLEKAVVSKGRMSILEAF